MQDLISSEQTKSKVWNMGWVLLSPPITVIGKGIKEPESSRRTEWGASVSIKKLISLPAIERVTWGLAKSIWHRGARESSVWPDSQKVVEVLKELRGQRRSPQGHRCFRKGILSPRIEERQSRFRCPVSLQSGHSPGVPFPGKLNSSAPLVCNWSRSQRWGSAAVFLLAD